MFCSKCGKEIFNEAVVCPSCGCATGNYPHGNNYSNYYLAISEFARKSNTIKILGILAACLCFGIGIIFSIIIWIQTSSIVIPNITTNNPKELADFGLEKKRIDLGKKLAGLPLIAIGICGFIAIFGATWFM